MLILLIGAGLFYVWRFIPTQFPSVLSPHVPSYAEWRDAQTPNKAAPANAQSKPVYRWRDKHGQTHISDKPPKGVRAERVRIDPNTNIVPMTHSGTSHNTGDDEVLEVIN